MLNKIVINIVGIKEELNTDNTTELSLHISAIPEIRQIVDLDLNEFDYIRVNNIELVERQANNEIDSTINQSIVALYFMLVKNGVDMINRSSIELATTLLTNLATLRG